MNSDSKIYVAGHRGLVGSAIVRGLNRSMSIEPQALLLMTHAEIDLTNQSAVEEFFALEKPEYVFLAAAKVGGIHANNAYPAEFIRNNLAIQTNIIHAAYKNNVKRLLFLGSSCIYPKHCPQPMKEEYLLTGPLESTNRPYAVAKIAGIEMCWSYNRQYGTRYLAAMPTNLYGPGDNYGLMNSHVIPAMIRKFHLAKMSMEGNLKRIIEDEAYHGAIPPDIKEMIGLNSNETITIKSILTPQKSVTLWGTGTPRREFLNSDDLAEACIYLMSLPDDEFNALHNEQSTEPPLINIGVGKDISIYELAEIVKEVVGYKGNIFLDSTKPDGTPRKLLDVTRLHSTGWQEKISLHKGIELVYDEFLSKNEIK